MPNEGYIKAYKETKDSIAEKSKSGTPKKVEELDKMMAKLKSLRENK